MHVLVACWHPSAVFLFMIKEECIDLCRNNIVQANDRRLHSLSCASHDAMPRSSRRRGAGATEVDGSIGSKMPSLRTTVPPRSVMVSRGFLFMLQIDRKTQPHPASSLACKLVQQSTPSVIVYARASGCVFVGSSLS